MFEDVLFTGRYENGTTVLGSKIHVMKKINAQVLIDDAMQNTLHMAEHGISSVLLCRPWNKQLVNLVLNNNKFYYHINEIIKGKQLVRLNPNLKRSHKLNDVLNPVDIDDLNPNELPIIGAKNWRDVKKILSKVLG